MAALQTLWERAHYDEYMQTKHADETVNKLNSKTLIIMKHYFNVISDIAGHL